MLEGSLRPYFTSPPAAEPCRQAWFATSIRFGYDADRAERVLGHVYSHDLNEPPHVHIDRDDWFAKFWLNPVSLSRNLGFKPKELRVIERLLVENEALLLAAWQEHLGAEA